MQTEVEMAVSRRLAATGLALSALFTVVTGCSSSPTDGKTPTTLAAPNPTPAVSTSAPTSDPNSSSSPAPDPKAEAAAQARALVPKYLAQIDKLYLDPTQRINDIYAVATGHEATTEIAALGKFRASKYRQTGKSVLARLTVDSVDLSNEASGTPSTRPSVALTACVDVSGVGADDARGKSVVPASRKDYLIEQLTVVNIKYPDSSFWRVAAVPNRQANSCDG